MKSLYQTVHHEDASLAQIRMASDLWYNLLCHQCGTDVVTVHSKGHLRFIRDLNMANAQVFVQVATHKIWCSRCNGVRVERLDFADASVRLPSDWIYLRIVQKTYL